MNKIFKYCLLKYRPSYVLSEQVNIGILFMFAEDNKIVFEYPNKLKRLSSLFPHADLNYTKRYLATFSAKAKELSKNNLFVSQQFDNNELIVNEFLIADANSFFFSDWKVGVYNDIDKTISHLKNQYFANYFSDEDINRKDDDFLLRQFSERIKGRSNHSLFYKNKRIAINDFHWNFDLCWQNGTTNLVRSLSFDLKNKETFIDKANRHFGSITQLERKGFDTSNTRFDFWVVKPNDPNLFKVYDNALDILQGVNSKHRIIEEQKDFDLYIEEALNTVKGIDLSLFENEDKEKSTETN